MDFINTSQSERSSDNNNPTRFVSKHRVLNPITTFDTYRVQPTTCNRRTHPHQSCHAVRDSNRGQRGAIRKSVLPNRCDAVRDSNRGQRGTTVQKHVSPIAVTLSGIATVVNEVQSKSISTNRCDTVRYSNRGQRCATSKSICTNRGDTVRYSNRRQRCATCKSIFTNRCDTVRYSNRGQRCATVKSISPIVVTLSGIAIVVNDVQP